MDSSMDEVALDFSPLIRVYKDGRVERLMGNEIFSPSSNQEENGIQFKDVVINPETGVSARVYLPKTTNPDQKLPLLVYFHGGGFCIETPFSPFYHNYLNSLVSEANVIAVSVHYRRAPEHPLPTAYDDSWDAVKWVASHSTPGGGHEVWLKDYVDFDRIFFAGDSAGGNIAHNMAMRVGSEGLGGGVKLAGVVLIHPYFWGKEPIGGEGANFEGSKSFFGNLEGSKFMANMWLFVCPETSGSDDPLINPVMDPKLSRLGCSKVLVCVAEKDVLRDRGWYYYEELGKSGWGGAAEIMEAAGEDHVFHLFNTACENAAVMLKRLASFMNHEVDK